MKKLILTLAFAFAVSIAAIAQPKPVLKYKADGNFKIVQLTDIHYKYGKSGSKRALECINAVLDSEQPDFVIITGDLVYGDDVEKAIDEMTAPITQRGIPFSITFGNHDHQFDRTLSEIYDQVQAMPLSVLPERGDVESPDYTGE
ncbi:MAG: metallophosphoesterase, partial [Muribaculaceae bacterium]|nr:metallophosphoesterase [Muribaculaceae bacterium]